MLKDGLSMVDHATESMKDFNLGDFIEYDGNEIFTSGIDGGLLDFVNLKSAYTNLDNLMDTDLLSGLIATLDYLGLGQFRALLTAGGDLFENIANTIVELMTTFGASLFERLELLGILDNKCKSIAASNNVPSRFGINLLLGGLFDLLRCYGFDTQVSQIVDMVDPLVSKELVAPSYDLNPTGGSTFIPATTITERKGHFNDIIAKQLGTVLNENSIDNVIDMRNYSFTKDIAKYHEDPLHDIMMGLNLDTTKRDDPAGDYDKVVATLEYAGLTPRVDERYTKFSELAAAKSNSTTITITTNTTITATPSIADMQSLF